MNLEVFREYCLKKKAVTEDLPFGPDTLVFKVMGKAFVLTSISEVPGSCNLKCYPERAEQLREKYSSITPGYHMNKKHWNTVEWDGSVSDQLIFELIDHSYDLVINGLPKILQTQLNATAKKSMPGKSSKKKLAKKKKGK